MSYEAIQFEKIPETRVGWITLNRPDRLNAINQQMRKELLGLLEKLREDDQVRVVVIQGAGEKAFSAGADITEFGGGPPHRFAESGGFSSAPAEFPKPVIAAIDGYCLGGGMELALACDFRLVSKRSQLGQPEIHLGLIPGGGGTQRLARLVGVPRAKEMCMMGDRLTAEQAYEWGLVDHLYKNEEFAEKVSEFAGELARRAPIAVRLAKQIINEGCQAPLATALLLEREAFALLFTTEDMKEGMDAFLNKRQPQFKGK